MELPLNSRKNSDLTTFQLIFHFLHFVAGKVFTTSEDPLGIFYLTLGFTLALLLHFALMNFGAKFKVEANNEEIELEDDSQWHDIKL